MFHEDSNFSGWIWHKDFRGITIDVSRLEEAYSDMSKAVMIAHTLGN